MLGPDHIAKAIDEETQARIDADALLDNKVNQETQNRINATTDLQNQVDRLEGISHRASWETTVNTVVDEGQINYREGGGQGWAGMMAFKIHHKDISGRVHPMGTVQEGNLFMLEWVDDNDEIQGSGVWIVGTLSNSNDVLSFDPRNLVYASGRPPVLADQVEVRCLFTPADSGGGDYYDKAESDQRYLIKGTSDNVQLNNGGTKAQSYWLVKGTSTNVQLNNGTTKAQTDFLLKGSSTNVQLNNGTTKAQTDFLLKGNSTNVQLNNGNTVTQASLKGKDYPGTFTANGSTLYWTP